MGLKDQLRRLKRAANHDAVLIRQRDGSALAFERMELMNALYVAQVNRDLGEPPPSGPMIDALDGATLSERERIEQMGRGGAFLEFADDPDYAPDNVPDLSEP